MEIKFTSEITVTPVQSMGGDHMIAAAARVSTCGEEALQYADPTREEEVSGLINYLMKHRHGTPFEHGSMTFFVQAPLFVWREWHRHRIGFSYNEESARYKPLEPVFYIPPRDRPMIKVEEYKSARPEFIRCDNDALYNLICLELRGVYSNAYSVYEFLLDANIDPGLARDCLPVGIYSSCWVTCNPRSLMSFLSLRTHEKEAKFVSYPLYEIEVAARVCEEILAKGWPITYKAFVKNGRVGP